MKRSRRKLTRAELKTITSRRGGAVRRITAKPPPYRPTASACSAAGRRITAKPRPARAALIEEVEQVLDGQRKTRRNLR